MFYMFYNVEKLQANTILLDTNWVLFKAGRALQHSLNTTELYNNSKIQKLQ